MKKRVKKTKVSVKKRKQDKKRIKSALQKVNKLHGKTLKKLAK